MRQINLPVKKDDTILKEFDPITATVIVGTGAIALSLAQLLFQTVIFIKATKPMIDKKLTKKINSFLKSTKWKVVLIKEKSPNAFVMGPRIICVTTGLIKLLNEREVMGVMLHEAWHVKDLHVYKQLIYKYPFFYLIAFAAISVYSVTLFPLLGYMAAYIIYSVYEIPYNIIIGRRHEKAADSYAAKMGYANDLVSALEKLEKWYRSKVKSQPCGTVCKIFNKINEAIDEHPTLKNRIENILRSKELAKITMKKSFIKILKFIKRDLK